MSVQRTYTVIVERVDPYRLKGHVLEFAGVHAEGHDQPELERNIRAALAAARQQEPAQDHSDQIEFVGILRVIMEHER